MGPRRRPRLRSNSPARYVRQPGSGRRYLDRNTGQEISYYERYKRLHGGQTPTEATARRAGFESASERRSRLSRITTIEGRTRLQRPTVRRTLRRRGNLAETWGEALMQGGEDVPTVVSGPRRGMVNRTVAQNDPRFIELETRLARLSREAQGKRSTDPFFDPNGEYARTLEELGRRPSGYAYRVGDSPPGTVQAMIDLRSTQPSLVEEAQRFFTTNTGQVAEAS